MGPWFACGARCIDLKQQSGGFKICPNVAFVELFYGKASQEPISLIHYSLKPRKFQNLLEQKLLEQKLLEQKLLKNCYNKYC